MTVLKRDGRTLEFDHSRIRAALAKAFVEVHGKLTPLTDRALNDLVEAGTVRAIGTVVSKGRQTVLAQAQPVPSPE